MDIPALALIDVPVAGERDGRTISFSVPGGEIACIREQGFDGLELLAFLAGLKSPLAGKALVWGQEAGRGPGLAVLVRGGRRLVECLTVHEHLVVARPGDYEELLDEYSLRNLRPHIETPVVELDFALRQETEIAMAVLGGAGSLLLHRPFEALFAHERRRLLSVLEAFTEKGGACLYTTRHNSPAGYGGLIYQSGDSVSGQYPVSTFNTKPLANRSDTDFTSDFPGDTDNPYDVLRPANGRIVGVVTRSRPALDDLGEYCRLAGRDAGRGGRAFFCPLAPWGGLAPGLTIEQNLVLFLNEPPIFAWGHARPGALRSYARTVLAEFLLDDVDPAAYPGELPQGKRIMVNLAGLLARLPSVLYVFRPCGGRFGSFISNDNERIMSMLGAYAGEGGAVVLLSDDVELIARFCVEIRVFDSDIGGRRVFDVSGFREVLR